MYNAYISVSGGDWNPCQPERREGIKSPFDAYPSFLNSKPMIRELKTQCLGAQCYEMTRAR